MTASENAGLAATGEGQRRGPGSLRAAQGASPASRAGAKGTETTSYLIDLKSIFCRCGRKGQPRGAMSARKAPRVEPEPWKNAVP